MLSAFYQIHTMFGFYIKCLVTFLRPYITQSKRLLILFRIDIFSTSVTIQLELTEFSVFAQFRCIVLLYERKKPFIINKLYCFDRFHASTIQSRLIEPYYESQLLQNLLLELEGE